MKNIGQRIKALRKRNDLTQEKLADFLGVTYKAVSKWECGITMPDLALIGPLTKIFHVSADELLGLTKEDTFDERRAELEENLRQAWINGGELDGFALVYKAEKAIVQEYPDDMKTLHDFAYTVSNRALHSEDMETEMRRAIRLFETVIETTNDELLKNSAIAGITHSLACIRCDDEARQYAEMLPESPAIDRSCVLEYCLRGEDLRKHRQKRLACCVHGMISLMEKCAQNRILAIQHTKDILNIIFPDGEYLEYHCDLAELTYKEAVRYVQNGMYDEAIAALGEYKEHSIRADNAEIHAEELRYTSPYLDLLVLPSHIPEECYPMSHKKAFDIQMQNEEFSVLRDREDFKALLE